MARAWQIPKGDDLGDKICKAVGIDPQMTCRVILDCQVNEPVYVYVQMLGGSELLDIEWEAGLGEVKIIKVGAREAS